MTEINGSFDDRFSAVRDAMAANFSTDFEVGASVAVTVNGKMVVDLWAGHTDLARTTPWERDTITNVWSTTKTMTALCALLLADRGELDFDAPVARYWPEFAANGKKGVLVRHLMGHTSGLSGWQEPSGPEMLYDWEKATSLLAAQAPWWEPGNGSGYHAITQGYLVGEVVRRISGRTLGTFFREELAEPLGADFHIGLAPEHDARVTGVIAPAPLDVTGIDPASVAFRTYSNPPISAPQALEPAWRRAEIPAAGGHGNARSVARVQSVLACQGELDGHRFLSAEGCARVFQEQAHGVDMVLGIDARMGMGYGLSSATTPMPNERTHFWGGWGGSLVVVDQENHVCIAYVMNRMGDGTVGDMRAGGIVAAAYQSLAG